MAIRSKPTSTNATSFSSYSAVAAASSSSAAVEFDFIGDVISPHLQGFSTAIGDERMVTIDKLILDLAEPDRREEALHELIQKRTVLGDLAPRLWFSFGTTAILLQEVTSVYPLLSAPALTLAQSIRVCNALVLLQCMASHLDTRKHFLDDTVRSFLLGGLFSLLVAILRRRIGYLYLQVVGYIHVQQLIRLLVWFFNAFAAYIPMYLYPLLNTRGKTKPYEFLRLTTLGVIGALVKDPDTEAILFLLTSEIMPLCLHAMEIGSDLSRTVATFILQRILLDDVGMDYVCHTLHRLFAVNQALGNVVAEQPSHQLLNLVIRCYLRFSEDERSLWVLRRLLPKRLIDGTFSQYLWVDKTMRVWLQQLLDNVRRPPFAQEDVS